MQNEERRYVAERRVGERRGVFMEGFGETAVDTRDTRLGTCRSGRVWACSSGLAAGRRRAHA